MTKEEAIIQDWIATLQTINPLNEYAAGKNYLTDIGDNVEYWLTIPEPDEEIKQLVIEDRICEGEEISDPTAAHYQVLELINTVYYPDGADTATRQGEAKADIIRCIGANWQNFLNKYKDVVIKNISTEKNVIETSKTIGGIKIIVKIRFGTEPFLIGEHEYTAGF